MKAYRHLIVAAVFVAAAGMTARAQGRSELAFSLGGGSLQAGTGGGSTPVLGFSYQFHITGHVSAEGALDFFYYRTLTGTADNPTVYKDDYAGAEAAIIVHLVSNRETGRWLPFVAAGIGRTTTDFTEIPGAPYYRLGVGAGYNLNDRLGIRIEIRDEIISRLWAAGNPHGNLPSIRCGIVYRF